MQLEDSPHPVLVRPQQARNPAINERRLLFDQRLDRLGKRGLHRRRVLGRLAVDTAPRQSDPAPPSIRQTGPQAVLGG